MQLGMIGLGKMGANMSVRLMQGGHEIVAGDLNPAALQAVADLGATPATDMADLVKRLAAPRAVWVMIPAGVPTENTLAQLSELLSPGDMVIDGGNSNYKDTVRRGALLAAKGISLVDCGTSGGVWGLENGYSMMIGGEKAAVDHLAPIFQTLAPSPTSGWGHVGGIGAGHFAKMIHNGIEYGMMQAFAEGFAILEAKTEYNFDLEQLGRIWQTGSVIRSWLLDLTTEALAADATLEEIAAFVPDSGEGRWTVFEAIDLNVSAPIITLSLERRIRSREAAPFADKMLAIMRNAFGGHAFLKEKKDVK
jgi:6-phosphogluconate dehydrogenase